MTDLQKLEGLQEKARARRHTTFADHIRGALVSVKAHSSMINRGMATGDCTRLTYKLNGKRASADAVWQHVTGS